MAMVNMNNLLNGKDSRWLQLEVCREFQRNKCTRPDTECKFAHPPANVEVQNGRVTACYDSIKGRCNREKPPCKYFHPPQHLKDQLLINGRNHLALKNALMQQMGLTPGQSLVPGQVPAVATNPYLTGMPQVGSTYSPYFAPSPIMPAIMGPADPTGVGSPLGVVPQTVAMPQKMPRTDRLETATVPTNVPGMGAMASGMSGVPAAVPGGLQNANMASIELGKKRMRDSNDDLLMMDMKSVGSFYYENFAFPGMVPYKRPAGDKSGMPVYQPTGATTYQQLMQLQQPFVPVSCEYTGTSPLPQTSNQTSIVSSQNSVQSQGIVTNASGLTDANGHPGILVDPNNPPPPPSAGGDKQVNSNHDNENVHNSPELNHSNSPQVSQLTLSAPPSMSPMTSMAGLTSMPSVVGLTSMANMANVANMTSMANYTAASMASINVLNSLGMGPALSIDPATLAKEVAQKNYVKAVKLSQASQSYGINPLTALNYTGIALNKQALNMNPPPGGLHGTATSRSVIPSLSGIPGALTTSLPAGILAYPRPPPATAINPYSLMRPQILPTSYMQTSIPGVPGTATIQANPYMQNPYAMIPGVTTAIPTVSQMPTGNPTTIAAQPQVAIPASSGVVVQPYKKMKTT